MWRAGKLALENAGWKGIGHRWSRGRGGYSTERGVNAAPARVVSLWVAHLPFPLSDFTQCFAKPSRQLWRPCFLPLTVRHLPGDAFSVFEDGGGGCAFEHPFCFWVLSSATEGRLLSLFLFFCLTQALSRAQ